jgi:hypothetical protein
VVVPGFDPCLCAVEVWGRRAVTRRRWRHRARLPGRRAARRTRDHGCERPYGRHTPEPSRVVRFSRRVLKPGRLAPEPSAGGAPRGRGAARALRRALGVRVAPERVSPAKRAIGRIWALSPTIFSSAGRRPGTVGSRGIFCRLVKEVGGLWSLGHFGPKPDPGGNESAGPPTAQQLFWPVAAR